MNSHPYAQPSAQTSAWSEKIQTTETSPHSSQSSCSSFLTVSSTASSQSDEQTQPLLTEILSPWDQSTLTQEETSLDHTACAHSSSPTALEPSGLTTTQQPLQFVTDALKRASKNLAFKDGEVHIFQKDGKAWEEVQKADLQPHKETRLQKIFEEVILIATYAPKTNVSALTLPGEGPVSVQENPVKNIRRLPNKRPIGRVGGNNRKSYSYSSTKHRPSKYRRVVDFRE